MFETLGVDSLTAPQAAVWFGLILGLGFGALAQITRFCFRRSLIGSDRRAAAGVWLAALAAAVIGTQGAVAAGWIDFADHRFHATDLPVLAILVGGALFGAGMILARGCASRLTVLAGSGNLRAGLVLVVFAITAHATLKGVLAPVRVALADLTIPTPALPGPALAWAAVIALGALVVALRSGNRAGTLVLAVLLGLLVPVGWLGTGLVLQDEFDPIAVESLSFTAPATEALFWTIAATSIPASFGTALFGGVLVGAAPDHAGWAGRLRRSGWQSDAVGRGGACAGGHRRRRAGRRTSA